MKPLPIGNHGLAVPHIPPAPIMAVILPTLVTETLPCSNPPAPPPPPLLPPPPPPATTKYSILLKEGFNPREEIAKLPEDINVCTLYPSILATVPPVATIVEVDTKLDSRE